jgi:hypothetical protein
MPDSSVLPIIRPSDVRELHIKVHRCLHKPVAGLAQGSRLGISCLTTLDREACSSRATVAGGAQLQDFCPCGQHEAKSQVAKSLHFRRSPLSTDQLCAACIGALSALSGPDWRFQASVIMSAPVASRSAVKLATDRVPTGAEHVGDQDVGIVHTVAVVGGTHGNERTGYELVQHFARNPGVVTRPSFNTVTLIANTEAVRANRRYIDKDLNRQVASSPIARSCPHPLSPSIALTHSR